MTETNRLVIPDLSSVPDLTLVSENEYTLRVISVKPIASEKTGRQGMQLVCKIEGVENAENVFLNYWFPMSGDNSDKAMTMMRIMKQDLQKMGMDVTQEFDAELLKNVTFQAYLVIEEYEGRESNKVKKIIG